MELCAEDQLLSDTAEWFSPAEGDPIAWYAKRSEVGPLTFLPSELTAEKTAAVAPKFYALRDAWHREYGASSSLSKITSCRSYREIIRMGRDALPFIFRDLDRAPEPDHWFDALREITNADPVPMKDRGHPRRMAKAWLKWARSNGYA